MTIDHDPGRLRCLTFDLSEDERLQLEEDDGIYDPPPTPRVRVAAISVHEGDPAALAAEIISSVTPHVASVTWGVGRVEVVLEPVDSELATDPLYEVVARWSRGRGAAEVDACASRPEDWDRHCFGSTTRIARALIPPDRCQCGFGAVPPPDACDCYVTADRCACRTPPSEPGTSSIQWGCLVAPDAWPAVRRRLAEQALAHRSPG